MNKTPFLYLSSFLLTLALSSFTHADGLIKKEVYSFEDKNGNLVFTDKQPAKEREFKTQTIEAVNSTGNTQATYQRKVISNQNDYSYSNNNKEQLVRVIVEDGRAYDKKSYKKKRSLKRCKSFKRNFDYYSDKMKAGYKNSEYKKLEKNRKKYRNLLFKNCETNTFAD